MRLRSTLLAIPLIFALGCASAYSKAIGRADELARLGQWDLAAAEYERALALEPGDPEALGRLSWARRNQAAERVQRARALLAQGNAPAALALAADAARLDPASVDARRALSEAGARTLDLADQRVAAGEARRALDLTTQVLAALPEDPRARRLDAAVRGQLAGEAYARGEAFAQQGRLGNALLEIAASALYVPGYRDAAARAGQLRRALREEVTFFAVVAPFSADASARGLAGGVSADRIRQAVGAALPLEVIAAPPEGRAAPGVRISGAFERYAYRHDEATDVRSCLYVCGRSTVTNPARAPAEDALRDADARLSAAEAELPGAQADAARAEREVDDIRRAIDRAQADADRARAALDGCRRGTVPQPCEAEQREVGRAEERLRAEQARLAGPERAREAARSRVAVAEDRRATARADREGASARLRETPRTIEVERQCSHGYGVAVHSVAAVVTARVSGESLQDGALLIDREPILCEERDRDEAFPAQPGRCAEVAGGDPLELPSELELQHALLTQAVAGARDKILFAYDRYRQQYLASAQREQAAGVIDEATERYARYLVLGRVGAGERAAIVEYLARARGLTPGAVDRAL